ncbi:hypothetical protein [Tahibacter amnicola]|uniref:Secreted protein (IPTL-CTERM system target) n=1 Tax=Tahibacter amnicola TaxID=2976241 RepID=A0ABY6BLP0_9GAMM|nr:hypothetical protein [Tahibacter amnicola]UXI70363.1 hypothetical protein N4264_12235 [Tahibacter amnicola]
MFGKSVWMLGVVTLGLAFGRVAAAQEISNFSVRLPPPAERDQPIPPGGEGRLTFTVLAAPAQFGTATTAGFFESPPEGLSEYTFVPENPALCQPPTLSPTPYSLQSLSFRVGPIAAGGSASCAYRVQRAATSRQDLKFHICANTSLFCNALFRYGTLPDVAVRITQSAMIPNSLDGTVQVTVSNRSSRAISAARVATDCVEFGGGIFDPAPFEIDADFPGACPRNALNMGCLNFTGQNYSSQGFSVGPIPAQGEASCLLRLRHINANTIGRTVDLMLATDALLFADGGVGYDANVLNDRTPMGVVTSVALPIGRGASVLTLVLLGLVGAWGVRRHIRATSAAA